jgi:hypothetical protein
MLVRDQSCFSADSVGISAARAQAEELDRMIHRGEADQRPIGAKSVGAQATATPVQSARFTRLGGPNSEGRDHHRRAAGPPEPSYLGQTYDLFYSDVEWALCH